MIQSKALMMSDTYLQNTLISTNWHLYRVFPKEVFPASVAYCGSIIMSD